MDDDDVPDNLKFTVEEQRLNGKGEHLADKHSARWEYVMGEMIFAFDTLANNYEDWDVSTSSCEINKRTKRGLALFAKYYSGLWD